MQVVHEVCCGLDVHKKSVTACVLWASGRRRQKREFGTFTKDLLEMSDWLQSCGVTQAVLESTGVYWKPVWNLLEGQFEVLLVKAQHIKAVPGRKTDQKDSEWIADLLQHGLLRASFVPPTRTRELRDLTRYRASLAQEIDRRSAQSLGHRLLHSARQDLLPRSRPRLLRSPEPRRLAPTLNQTTGRLGLQSDPGARSSSHLEEIF
jgi:transposase